MWTRWRPGLGRVASADAVEAGLSLKSCRAPAAAYASAGLLSPHLILLFGVGAVPCRKTSVGGGRVLRPVPGLCNSRIDELAVLEVRGELKRMSLQADIGIVSTLPVSPFISLATITLIHACMTQTHTEGICTLYTYDAIFAYENDGLGSGEGILRIFLEVGALDSFDSTLQLTHSFYLHLT